MSMVAYKIATSSDAFLVEPEDLRISLNMIFASFSYREISQLQHADATSNIGI